LHLQGNFGVQADKWRCRPRIHQQIQGIRPQFPKKWNPLKKVLSVREDFLGIYEYDARDLFVDD